VRNPWLGLASFTEEIREYFFGRDEEVAELARRVQRKLLTVLFGKSGLGKTSILRAGLVPRLRAQGYCPVYVRIAYGRETPEPTEQIKAAIGRAADACGQWTQVGVAAPGESLWEFLHHRDDVLRDAAGATLSPLLIFDQFEELFTLAQTDEFGRSRAARFIEELADLVENRPPKALEARLDADDEAAGQFDFERGDYRVLISLREDYLAPLESLKRTMPSLAQNRLRLSPMTGGQALEAVLRPGRGLVTEEVAAAIVRFVAGGSELANAEVEPSLLSLICRELNDARLAQGRDEISIDLLAGSHENILTNFYERSLADQPAAVRRIIEDELLTDSGYRENVAEETLLKHLQAAGAAPGALSLLVNRRLLRIEERLDVRRVELTHDVLCSVVRASRDQRHERETREAAERVLEEQRAREQAARHALRRARAVAGGCILLAALAISTAVYAYLSDQRARRAELAAQQSRSLAEQARSHSEQLLAYLTDDFVRELESFGRVDVVAEFTQRQIDYFHSLPPELRSAGTVRNGALALIDHARALGSLGDFDGGRKSADEAVQLIEELRRDGDASETTQVALGMAYSTRCTILDRGSDSGGSACSHAIAILEPLAQRPDASVAARRAYLETLAEVGWENAQSTAQDAGKALRATQRAMQIATELGAKDLRNLEISADYADAGSWQMEALAGLDRDDEAVRVGKDALAVADGVLAQRPWYRNALHTEEVIDSALSLTAIDELHPREGLKFALQGRKAALNLLRLDPNNVMYLANLGRELWLVGSSQWSRGHLEASIDRDREALGPLSSDKGEFNILTYLYLVNDLGFEQAVSGNLAGAVRTSTRALAPAASAASSFAELVSHLVQAEIAYERDDFAGASRIAAQASMARQRDARPMADPDEESEASELFWLRDVYGQAEYQRGHFAAAENAEREALGQPNLSTYAVDRRGRAEASIWLAMALARQGKLSAAREIVGPIVRFEQSLLARNHGDVWVPYELACALYAESLAEPARRVGLLRRATALLNGLPPRLQRLHDVRQWQRRIGS